MFDKIIHYSIHHKVIVICFLIGLVVSGVVALRDLPLDAVPDITNNQVQVITQNPTLGAQEMEKFVTAPTEAVLLSLPGVEEVRSISRSGISVITVVFNDATDIYRARQLVNEKISLQNKGDLASQGSSELAPMTTGLGEFYQYYLKVKPGYEGKYSLTDLRTIQDWQIKRRLYGIPGVIEISSYGGNLKQIEIAIDPDKLRSANLSISDVYQAVHNQNENTGAGYIEKNKSAYFIRGEGMATSANELNGILIANRNGIPVFVSHVATVKTGHAIRFGALTANGQGEVVGGVVLLTKGENSYQVVKGVKARIAEIQASLPEGLTIEPFIDRSHLINSTIRTVSKNLIEGGLIVVFVLVLVLGNWRAGIIVASVIPLAMLFAISMMKLFGVSANLMSLGAIDFGLVVDGAVIVVEASLHQLHARFSGKHLSNQQMNDEIYDSASKIRGSASFGEFIILLVYIPILALTGVEGKMFGPMAQTVIFAIIGALILSLTWVPLASSLFLSRHIHASDTFSDRVFSKLRKLYQRYLLRAFEFKKSMAVGALVLMAVSVWLFGRLGGEFIPELDEGDFAIETRIVPGSSLTEMIHSTTEAEKILRKFPEVTSVVSRIGSSEIPTDPMPIESADVIVSLKPKKDWTSATTTDELVQKMEAKLSVLPGIAFDFMYPIQMRFNELISGIKADVAVKIFGDDMDILTAKAQETAAILQTIKGVTDLKVEQTEGLPQILVKYRRDNLARYGIQVSELNLTLRAAFAGEKAGILFEGDKWFDITIRLDTAYRKDLQHIEHLFVSLPDGNRVPFGELADISYTEAPMQISRETGKRRVYVSFNVQGRDMETVVNEASAALQFNLKLDNGYYTTFGGQYQTLTAAKKQMGFIVPATLAVILLLLYLIFQSGKESFLVFSAVPFSAIGGVFALWLRDMPFSISAGIGFIALFGVSVLNSIVLISHLMHLQKEGHTELRARILTGTSDRFRSVLITALVASLGFIPMAISTSAGAEVQKPLATVVIGGLLSSTLLILFVVPVLYEWLLSFNRKAHENL